MIPEYFRDVLTNNIERANDIVWDLKNKPEFDKNDGSVLGVIAVAEQVVVSLTALLVDHDNIEPSNSIPICLCCGKPAVGKCEGSMVSRPNHPIPEAK